MMRSSSVRQRFSQLVAAWHPFSWGSTSNHHTAPQWVEWAESHPSSTATSTDSVHVAHLKQPSCVPSVVLTSTVLPVGATVKQGDEVAVVEWVELHPFLPVQHRESVASPCDGQVEYGRGNAVMPYAGATDSDSADEVYVVVRQTTTNATVEQN